jgi:hypothetical protein
MADAASSPAGSVTYGRGPDGSRLAILSWTAVGGTATGSWLEVPGVAESVHVTPTASFGGATLVLQGSNEPITTTTPVAVGITSDGAAAISVTANALKKIWEQTTLIRPLTTGGTATAINVYVKCRVG